VAGEPRDQHREKAELQGKELAKESILECLVSVVRYVHNPREFGFAAQIIQQCALFCRSQIGQQSPRFCRSLERSGTFVRVAGFPAALDGKEHLQFYGLDTRLAHTIGAILHALFAARRAPVILEVKPHFMAMICGNDVADFGSGSLWQEPWLEKDIGQKVGVIFRHLGSSGMAAAKSGGDSIIAYPCIDLGRSQVGMAEQFLNGANIGSTFQHVRGEAVTQHVRIHHAEVGSPSDILHDAPKGTSCHGAVWLWAFQIDFVVSQILVELAPCGGIGQTGRIAQVFHAFPAAIAVVAPVTRPCDSGASDVALLPGKDILKQVTNPSLSQIVANRLGRRRTEIHHALFALAHDRKTSPLKVDSFSADLNNFSDAATSRIEQFHQRTVAGIVRGPNQFFCSSLRKSLG
jgi:hypothetical protein